MSLDYSYRGKTRRVKRKRYLNMVGLQEARRLFFNRFKGRFTSTEKVPSNQAAGRVTGAPVFARFSSPSFHSAAMDGIAVRAEDTFSAHESHPVSLDLKSGEAVFINTGQPMPPDKNAVIMIEHVSLDEQGGKAVIMAPAYPWQHVRKIGEDIVATELLFPTHHLLSPADIGALIAAGVKEVVVRKRPRVVIIPTGSELIALDQVEEAVPHGKTIESNSAMLAALSREAGAEVKVASIVEDQYELIRDALRAAVEEDGADLVILNAGSSAGSADYTVKVVEELGEVLVHGVTIMPGKPTVLGDCQGVPVTGNPGYPVSALISFEQFIGPLLMHMQGLVEQEKPKIKAVCGKSIPSKSGIQEFRRMVAGRLGERIVALPVKKGAGAITTMTRANAMLSIPAESEGVMAGDVVELELLRPLSQVESTILSVGSHDLTLDIIHDLLRRGIPPYYMAMTHVGSLGGIVAVRDGLCHLAGTHLLDPESGEYNVSYIERYLKGKRRARLYNLVYREQGLMVRHGNPKGIQGIRDLTRDDIQFVNRQPGSGTRVLLDHELKKAGISPGHIKGYDNEEYTHMAVAVSVLSGKADAGLGILAAARALGLDFIPVAHERYDILIPEEALGLPSMERLLEIIQGAEFKERVEALGGYSARDAGRLLFEI